MKKNNKNLDFTNYSKLNRAIIYIALFSLVINLGYSQINDELEAYNPLIPNGSSLVVTILFEIAGVEDNIAREALKLAAFKLPIKTKIVVNNNE